MKAILRGFELVSGLKVNFSKSNLFGLNLDDPFLFVLPPFCLAVSARFPLIKFLSIPVGQILKDMLDVATGGGFN